MKKRIVFILVFIIAISVCLTACSFSGTPGKSAYEIACDNGFTGTQQEWLDSLAGKDARLDVDIYDLYDAYLVDNPNATLTEFIKQLVNTDLYDAQHAAVIGAQSMVSVFSSFRFGTIYQTGAGAGVIYKVIDDYAYIITNFHVIYERTSSSKLATAISIYSYGYERDGYGIDCEFIGGSITKDIAVLKASVSDFYTDIVTASLGDEVSVGEGVVAIGNPRAEGTSISSGIVSKDSETIDMMSLTSAYSTVSMRVIRTDTAINSGNSGGGLFNLRGELIGIVNAKIVDTGIENIGYAIPLSVAVGITQCVIDGSEKAILGVSVSSDIASVEFNTLTNQITIVESLTIELITSAIANACLQVGDKVRAVWINDGEPFAITRSFHMPDFLYAVRLGDIVHLEVERDGEIMQFSLTPGTSDFIAL